jgi:hypothetical protein
MTQYRWQKDREIFQQGAPKIDWQTDERMEWVLKLKLDTHLPVLGLVDAISIGLCVLALRVEGSNGGAELRHGVQVGGEVVQHGDHVRWKTGTVCPLLGQGLGLE